MVKKIEQIEEKSRPFFKKIGFKIFFGFLVVFLIIVIMGFLSLIEILKIAKDVSFSAEINEVFMNLFNFIFIAIIISLISAIGIGFYISRRISQPIKKLNSMAKEIEKGNFKINLDLKTEDELEQLGKTLNQMAQSLDKLDLKHKQLEKAKTEFLSITSHELRSPMTPMKAQLQMLIKEYFGKLNEEQKKSLNIILKNADRLDKIIVDFLDISRLEAARLKFDFRKIDLTKTVNDTVEYMKAFDVAKKIKIVTKIDKLPIIEADSDRFSQILRNLIGNAIKFSPVSGQINVKVKLQGEMILCSVEDHGIGISAENQTRIFEPFFQVDKAFSRKKQGTGLGLAISRGIVKAQNGKIWIESMEGKGSIFYFTIPLKPVKEIKPIKILFSAQKNIEEEIKLIFVEILGSIGEKEFEGLKVKNEITEPKLIEYINLLIKKGILLEEKGILFKTKILEIFHKKGLKTKEQIAEEVKELYVSMLGFFGESEFIDLQNRNHINKNDLIDYVGSSIRNGALTKEKGDIFKDKILNIFEGDFDNSKGISMEDLIKRDLIKIK